MSQWLRWSEAAEERKRDNSKALALDYVLNAVSPTLSSFENLVKAEDAIEIDNSNLTLEEQFKKILNLVEETLNK